MEHFVIEPNIGVGPIKLGMHKSEVESIFGKPEHENDNRASFLSGFMVDYNELNNVEFIELASSNKFNATYEGKNLHKIPANEAVEFVGKFDAYDSNDPELGYSYIFKTLQLSLWRGTLPENSNDEDGKYFEAVGIGGANYFE
jgi:hypothetical protein